MARSSAIGPCAHLHADWASGDHSAFLFFFMNYRNSTNFAEASGTTENSPLPAPREEDLSHFVVFWDRSRSEISSPGNLVWHDAHQYWLAYTTPVVPLVWPFIAYRYVKAEWWDRHKLGDQRMFSKEEWRCEEDAIKYDVSILRRAS
ncbi:hypothetical protein LTR27_009413 [Elasticomyces elasticus]|nr:hypothetical protein LTR27_009413 [Elasticomyces elasticus]